ncbi:aKG-HExxH-type peptide beta-hydroxylase [Actinacidiphila paucisporea]|uniref:HEXXH motif-containing protein n=1 Tax=Actinacidiphila paucisporea TaxID=310782 RepID=A0A1M6V779_9ACTN|nr:HEXXH motif-containing putative peptide modification protein [Actinacidiphila paucisporea]SHK77332.1 HEXXH motif-containing protein [Actinacidiphila paucisporea]
MTVTDDMLRALGGTGGDARALDLLVTQQRRRRLLVLRALLDAVAEAPPSVLPPAAAARALADWRLLAAAERADPAAAHRVVHYPMTGAWADRALRALTVPDPQLPPAETLAHLGALAAAAAARAGLRFTADVTARGGLLTLPTVGACAVGPGVIAVRVAGEGGTLWLHLPAGGGAPARKVEVRRGPDGTWRSAAAGWRPIRALRADGGPPVLIDDVDPYREERRTGPYGLPVSGALDPSQHARWRTAWQDAQPWTRLGGAGRTRETGALLGCFVPLADSATAQYSATRGDAFGALLSSTPRSGLELAATLVHELQHAKLFALSAVTVLHTADGSPRYWAPWRPDPRPFDGLFQGAYAHVALADFHLRVALGGAAPAVRDAAWADHCRCRQQVDVALPQLLGSNCLTPQGRTLVTAMAAHQARLKSHAPPDGHLARAAAYVETARAMWRRGQG